MFYILLIIILISVLYTKYKQIITTYGGVSETFNSFSYINDKGLVIEKKLYNKEELLSKISVLFGGRAAEDVMFDKITTGASDDIERATELIYSMITTYGLSNKIGLLNYNKSRRYNIGQNKLNDIETEMTEITDEIYKWTSKIIEIHKEKIIKLAESLLKNEILLGEDIESLIDEDKNLINSLDIIKLIER